MKRVKSSPGPMTALMLPAIGEGRLVHFDLCTDAKSDERLNLKELDWRDDSGGSFSRPSGSSAGKPGSPPYRSFPHQRRSDSSPSRNHSTETVTLLPFHFASTVRTRPRFFLPRGDEAWERSGSTQSNRSDSLPKDQRDLELPRLNSHSHGSADSNARNSNSLFLPMAERRPGLLAVDSSPKVTDDHQGSLSSQVSLESALEEVGHGHGHVIDTNPELSTRLQPREILHEPEVVGRGALATRQRTIGRPEVRQRNSAKPGWYSYNLNRILSKSISNISKGSEGQGHQKKNRTSRLLRYRSEVNLKVTRADDNRGFYNPPGDASTRLNPVTHVKTNSLTQISRTPLTQVNPNPLTRVDTTPLIQANPSSLTQVDTTPLIQANPSSLTQVNMTPLIQANPDSTQANRKRLFKSQSQPVIRQKTTAGRKPLANQEALRPEVASEPQTEATMKAERIVEWLLETEGYAEPPESPVICEDGPEQSDTAIHIVYEGD